MFFFSKVSRAFGRNCSSRAGGLLKDVQIFEGEDLVGNQCFLELLLKYEKTSSPRNCHVFFPLFSAPSISTAISAGGFVALPSTKRPFAEVLPSELCFGRSPLRSNSPGSTYSDHPPPFRSGRGLGQSLVCKRLQFVCKAKKTRSFSLKLTVRT